MGLLNYTPELDPNGQQVNRTAAMGNGVVNPGVPATEPVYYGDSADPKKKRKVSPWAILGAGLLGGVWSQHNPQGFDRAMGAIGQGLKRQQELKLKRDKVAADQAWRDREQERREEDRTSRETIAKGVAENRGLQLRVQQMLGTGVDPVTGMAVKYAEGSPGWARKQSAEARTTSNETQRMGLLGTDLQGNPVTAAPGSVMWGREQTGKNTQARTATEEMMRQPRFDMLQEQIEGAANMNAVTGNPVYQQGQINAQPLRNVHQEQVNDTFLAQNAAKTALLLAQIEKTLREPAPRGTGGKGGKGDAPADPNGAVAPRIYPNDLLANAGATGLPVSVASAIYSGYAGMFKKDSNGNIVRVKGIHTDKREAEMRAKFKAARQGKPVNPANTINTTGGMTGGDRASSGPQFGVLGGVQQMIDEARIVNSLKGPK